MSLQTSKALVYVQSKGWDYHTTDTQIVLTTCPICHDDGGHFYMSFDKDKDALWNCFKCGEKGNLYSLMEYNGDRMKDIVGLNDMRRTAAPLPNIEECHQRLLEEAESDADSTALDYLLTVRKWSMAVIERFKIGLIVEHGKRWLLIPHFVNGQVTFVKYRTLPPDKKEFRGVHGREPSLFNQDCMVKDMEEILLCEGEGDTLSCISQGIKSVVGIPGANVKKRTWIQKLDEIAPKKIYLLYDSDNVGQTAAKQMAAAIGIEKAWNIVLPEFTVTDPDGTEHRGKDINDYFASGHTVADLEELKRKAKPCSVDGVQSAAEVIESIKNRLAGQGTLKPKYVTPWESLNRKIGGFDDGDLVGIISEAKTGKLQSVNSLVLMQDGSWKKMGDLVLGDALASIDGKESFVTGLFPQGEKELFEVTFSDGRKTLAGREHLWKVRHVDEPYNWRIYTTDAIIDEYDKTQGWRCLFVPLISGDFGTLPSVPFDQWYSSKQPNDKFIPRSYLEADTKSRWELLHGITDCQEYGSLVYRTKSQQLCDDVVYLARSLGGTAIRNPPRHKNGQPEYSASLDLPVGRTDVLLTIKSIRSVGFGEAQCITVSHPSNLYVTDDFIVTHNTTMALNILDFFNKEYSEPVLAFCQEMRPDRLVTKWISSVTDTEENRITMDTVEQALVEAASRPADLLFAYTKSIARKDVFDTIRQAVRRYGVKACFFDNLQILCRNIEHSAQEANVISKEFKSLAMELGIVIFLIVQPNRVKDGEIVSARHSFGTSAVEKDVDIMLALHRSREGKISADDFANMKYLEVEENFSPEMLVRADLTRYASGGSTTLKMIGAKSKVVEFTEEDKSMAGSLQEISSPGGFAQA